MLLRRYHKQQEPQLPTEVVEDILPEIEQEVDEDNTDLTDMSVKQLKELAKEKGIEGYSKLDKDSLIQTLVEEE